MATPIERYLNSLSNDIVNLDIHIKDVTEIPDLTRFNNLKALYCYGSELTSLPTLPQTLHTLYCRNNKLTSLPTLPQNLHTLFCNDNQLTSLPTLPQNLKTLYCCNNQLTSLPTLPQNLKTLYCGNNQLTSLPTLPQTLNTLFCNDNQLTSLPTLPQSLMIFGCSDNRIYEVVDVDIHNLSKTKKNIQILNDFRYLYYCIKFKKQFRKWLWEKVREPKIRNIYSPLYLIENLGDEDDLQTFLHNWK
jgi:Leucine-rich repeat (LRR) protein